MDALLPVDADDGRLAALRRTPGGGRGPEARRAAATELQVMFLTQLLRAMRKTVPENDFLPRSPARNVYEGAFDRSVAEAIAARDPLGLVRTLAGDSGLKLDENPADTVTGYQDGRRGVTKR
jgi:Rod binding domain-containing protein